MTQKNQLQQPIKQLDLDAMSAELSDHGRALQKRIRLQKWLTVIGVSVLAAAFFGICLATLGMFVG